MTTPIIMLLLMTGPYALVRLLAFFTNRRFDFRRAAAVGLGLMFIFTGTGHFTQTESMAQMLPPWVPGRVLLVYLTGFFELAIAAGFLSRKSRRVTAWIAAAVLILFFPVNVYAALNNVPMGGHAWGPVYLLIRGPLQLIILLWIYAFVIKRAGDKETAAHGGCL